MACNCHWKLAYRATCIPCKQKLFPRKQGKGFDRLYCGTIDPSNGVSALEHDISSYNACYVNLAFQNYLPLVSAYQRLKRNLVCSAIQFLELVEL